MNSNEKTELDHWELAWSQRPRMSFPSAVDIGTRNVLRLLRRYVRPGMRYVEVGCAPGKVMSWVGREIGSPVHGIDYSPTGVEAAQWLTAGLGISADIRCEDATRTTLPPEAFDLVFSCGLVEHFDDPHPMVAAHLALLAPGGVAVIAVPNYSGPYLAWQRRCDPANLAIHNLEIMNPQRMLTLVPALPGLKARSFVFGRFSPWLISLATRWGSSGKALSWMLNFLAHLQLFDIPLLCPLVVLEVRRAANGRPQKEL